MEIRTRHLLRRLGSQGLRRRRVRLR
uniref:Uncharacterized protein MANES_07G081300 n=1 Tax=Rhizophora mucronata TaxID=61149 RepID=A0A2P2QD12_RHIMU